MVSALCMIYEVLVLLMLPWVPLNIAPPARMSVSPAGGTKQQNKYMETAEKMSPFSPQQIRRF